ncbi:MAG: hypothetical protein ACRBBP_00210 [Bdellovibrionales bacterium]
MNRLSTSVQEFFLACESLQTEFKRFDIEVEAVSKSARVRAESMNPEDLDAVTARINKKVGRYSKISGPLETTEDEARELWNFLKESGFKFSDNLFTDLEEGAYLKVYDVSFQAIYRSPNFYRATSYSIGDLQLYKWTELFDRAEIYNDQLSEALLEAFRAPLGTTAKIDVIVHSCTERFSPKQLNAIMHPLFLSTIQNKNGEKAVVAAGRVRNIIPRAELYAKFQTSPK